MCVYIRARLTCAQCFEHTWLKQDTNTMKAKKLSKERMKKYILRRKWQVKHTWTLGPLESKLQQEVLSSLCSSLAENGSCSPSHREVVVHGHDGRSQRQERFTYRRLAAWFFWV